MQVPLLPFCGSVMPWKLKPHHHDLHSKIHLSYIMCCRIVDFLRHSVFSPSPSLIQESEGISLHVPNQQNSTPLSLHNNVRCKYSALKSSSLVTNKRQPRQHNRGRQSEASGVYGRHNNDRQYVDGMQTSGMTYSPSPVYLYYPPDPSGRRPSLHTQLQYTSPTDRTRATHQAAGRATDPTHGSQQNNTYIAQQTHTSSSSQPVRWNESRDFNTNHRPYQSNQTTARESLNHGAENGTSSQSSSPMHTPTRPQRTRPQTYWCCCYCSYQYLARLHSSCTTGCQRPRCSMCQVMEY